MAHHKSAKKRIRSDAAKRDRNSAYISSVRTAVKKFTVAAQIAESNKDDVESLFKSAQAKLAQATTKGLVHRNTSARKTSRLAALLKRFSDGNITVVNKVAKKKKVQRAKKKK